MITKTNRICQICFKPMGDSWHTETDIGELEIYIHKKCVPIWKNKQAKMTENDK